MKKLYSLLSFTFLFSFPLVAQEKGNIKGTLVDSSAKQPLADATITVLQAKDSALVTFSRSNKNGDFNVGYLDKGKYRLLITHVSYRNYSKIFDITENVKSIDLGYISLSNKSTLLEEVKVIQEIAPVTLRNDTIEFNAGAFKTKPNAVVEDLLKKLPGIQVDKDGKIKANGEDVKKVLVDGKQFFGNDPKLATKNLPADVVDKVQVFDKKSDQSQFTGFDDGNSEKTINLSLKPEKKNGAFGKIAAGAGNNERYQGNFNLNQFKGERQLSAIGMANNTNKQGFSFLDILNFSGGLGGPGGKLGQIDLTTGGLPLPDGGNNGLTTTWAGGMNFNDTYNRRLEINGSYFFNRIEDRIEQKTNRQYILPGNSFNLGQEALLNRRNENHRFNFSSDYKIDSVNSLKLTSSANAQQSWSNSKSAFLSSTARGEPINEGSSVNDSKSHGYSWNNSLLWRHRFAKKGRTISTSLSINLNEGNSNSKLNSLIRFFETDGSLNNADTINQQNIQNNRNETYGAVLSYTEPLSKKSLLEFNFNFNKTNSTSGKQTFDIDQLTGKHDIKNDLLSNDFNNTYQFSRAGLSWRYQEKKYNFSIGAFVQQALLETAFHFLGRDSSLNKSFANFLPDAQVQYNINKYKNLRFNYNTYTRQPSAQQLNPIIDLSDPLNIRMGNPGLSQEYNQRAILHYAAFDLFRKTSFFSMLNFSTVSNRIVNDDRIDSTGVRTTTFINVDGVYNLNAVASWGFPLRAIKSNLNLNTSLADSKNLNFINGARNIIKTWNISEEANLNFIHKEVLDITIGVNISYNAVRYSLPSQYNTNYWNQEYLVDLNIYLPKSFSLASESSFSCKTGYTTGFNTNVFLWNAGLARQLFLNKKGEIKFQVYDILNQNVGLSRNANQNYIEDVQTKILNRYFLLSFTYNLSKFAGKAAPLQNGGNIKIIGERSRM